MQEYANRALTECSTIKKPLNQRMRLRLNKTKTNLSLVFFYIVHKNVHFIRNNQLVIAKNSDLNAYFCFWFSSYSIIVSKMRRISWLKGLGKENGKTFLIILHDFTGINLKIKWFYSRIILNRKRFQKSKEVSIWIEAQTYGHLEEGIPYLQEYFRSSQGKHGENKKAYLPCLGSQCSGGGSGLVISLIGCS